MSYGIQHSFVDPIEVNYEGEALVLDFEFRGIPGLLWPLRETLELWANSHGQLVELFIWQDTDPLLDKWRVYMIAHGTPILALAAALPLLVTALKWLVITFIAWTVSKVIFKAQQPTAGEKILQGLTPTQLAGLTPAQIEALVTKPPPAPTPIFGEFLKETKGIATIALIGLALYLASKFVSQRGKD